MDYAKAVAKAGLEIGALKLNTENPFQWASGYRMPIYNDNRMFLFHPQNVDMILEGMQKIIEVNGIDYDVISGIATAGIPWGKDLAKALRRPFIYVRDKPKEHGLRNQIEGLDSDKDLEGRTVVPIEDLISTGESSAKAVEAIRNANGVVKDCVAIFSYGLDSAKGEFEKRAPECRIHSVLNYDVLLEVAIEKGYIDSKQAEMLAEWRTDPFGWGEKRGFHKVEKK